VPLTFSRMTFPADRLPDLPAALRAEGSITAALARCGVADYHRLWTRLTAERPTALIARHLRMPESRPVLRAESLNADSAGRPLQYGVSWFCSDRVQLVVDRSSFS
jgi:GntR family phosphonate transport system transcriptional regulator